MKISKYHQVDDYDDQEEDSGISRASYYGNQPHLSNDARLMEEQKSFESKHEKNHHALKAGFEVNFHWCNTCFYSKTQSK